MLVVSNYHYIRENFNSKYPSIFGVTPKSFNEQLLEFKNYGDFIGPTSLLENLDYILNSKDKFFLVTFDDGLKEQFVFGHSILDELGIEGLFFVNSSNIETKKINLVHKIHILRSLVSSKDLLDIFSKNKKFLLSKEEQQVAIKTYIYDCKEDAVIKYLLNFKLTHLELEQFFSKFYNNFIDEEKIFEELYMSFDEIKTLARNNQIGSHTHSHYPIAQLSENEIKFELEYSKKIIEDLTNTKVDFLSYPYGTKKACNEQVSQEAKNSGYKIGFTTNRGVNNGTNKNLLLLNRFDCNDLPKGKFFKKDNLWK
ncbi:MAG: polysaccharide deacetylase family protein [Flavobacteriaceae bacterium]|nr:polysaccharide deacetylase family protein [Flavobacteriaceae bacterium]